jgi:hypothetical protein
VYAWLLLLPVTTTAVAARLLLLPVTTTAVWHISKQMKTFTTVFKQRLLFRCDCAPPRSCGRNVSQTFVAVIIVLIAVTVQFVDELAFDHADVTRLAIDLASLSWPCRT